MYILPDGYYVLNLNPEKSEDYKPVLIEKPTFKESISEVTLLNTGGTVSSSPNLAISGVSPMKGGLYQRVEKLPEFNNLGYKELQSLKNSQLWTCQDYHKVWSFFKENHSKCSKWIVVHGTDNMGCFAPYMALIAKELRLKLVLTCTQRSLDKPTWEFTQLIKSCLRVLKKTKAGKAYVITYGDPFYQMIHSPTSIRKSHTYKKNSFFSENSTRIFEDLDFKLPHYETPSEAKPWNEFKKIVYSYPLPFSREPQNPDVCLGYGLGNLGVSDFKGKIFSRIPAGPLNPIIYSLGDSWDPEFNQCKNYSPQAYGLYLSLKS